MLKRVDFLLSYDPETGKFFWWVFNSVSKTYAKMSKVTQNV